MGYFFFWLDTRLTYPATAIPTIIRDHDDKLATPPQAVSSQLVSAIT
jgi:hypothetical protein